MFHRLGCDQILVISSFFNASRRGRAHTVYTGRTRMFVSSPITAGLEIPSDPGKLDDLTLLASSIVSLSGDTTVNLTLSLASGILSIGAHEQYARLLQVLRLSVSDTILCIIVH